MNQLADLLRGKRIGRPASQRPDIESDIDEAEEEAANNFREELETLLRSFEEHEVPPEEQIAEVSLEDPILLLLAQSRSFRICRRELFCPDESCHLTKRFNGLGQLTNRMQTKHGATREETADMFHYFISRMLPWEIEMKVITRDEHEVKREWSFCRCHYPGCSYINAKAHMVDSHVRTEHKEMKKDMKTLGWFWGTLRTMMKSHSRMTIAETLGQGQFWECTMEICHQPFQSQKALGHHYCQAHAAHTQEGWKAQSRRLTQTWKTTIEVEREEVDAGERHDARRVESADQGQEESGDEEVERLPTAQRIVAAERPEEPERGKAETRAETAPDTGARARVRVRKRQDHDLRVTPTALREREEARRREEEKRREQD
jgi:hypothetical protein